MAKLLLRGLPQHGDVLQLPARKPIVSRKLTGKHRVWILCVPDRAISQVATSYAPLMRRGDTVLHVSGLGGVASLAACAQQGAEVGVLHPLLAIYRDTGQSGPEPFFTVSGTPRAARTAVRVGNLLRWTQLRGVEPSALYHAAAVTVAAGTYALISHATTMLSAGAKPKG